jgi:hypothetical protein
VISGKTEAVRTSLFTVYRNTVRAVRTQEWKLILYPQRRYTQLFNLLEDPLEINNLMGQPCLGPKIDSLTVLLKDWQQITGDTASLAPATILPMEYDYKKLIQAPDDSQPEYILKKYFGRNVQ